MIYTVLFSIEENAQVPTEGHGPPGQEQHERGQEAHQQVHQ
jgi:hypothetical protein